MAVCRRRKIPFVTDERIASAIPKGPIAAFRFRFARRGAFAAFAASPDIRGWLAAHAGEGVPIQISPGGADTALFAVDGAPSVLSGHPHIGPGPLIVFAGSLSPHRPFGRLLDMAAAMRRLAPEVSFVICGDGPARLDLNAHAARLDVLERNVWFIPAMPRRDLPGLLAAATVIVAFGTEPDMPLSEPGDHIFDALAAAKPVAVFGGGWQRDLIESRQAGVVLPSNDGAGAARELVDFLRDADLVRRAGAQAGALASGRSGLPRILAEIRATLERAAAEHPRAAEVRRKLLAQKRTVDIVVSMVLLIALLPVWVALALAVAGSRRQWPLARTELTGLKARPFRKLSFASGAGPDGLARFLARTGLDIGPALLNVLGGDMSLVGPAPYPPTFQHFYTPAQHRRLDLRPGLVGHVSTATPAATTWEQRFIDDLWYIDHLALGLDAKIMAGGLWRVVTGRRRGTGLGLAQFDEIMARAQGAEDA